MDNRLVKRSNENMENYTTGKKEGKQLKLSR